MFKRSSQQAQVLGFSVFIRGLLSWDFRCNLEVTIGCLSQLSGELPVALFPGWV